MKKYTLFDFYFFNLKYILKALSDLVAFFIFFIFSDKIISFEGLIFYSFISGIFFLIIFPDIFRSNKEGIFFLKSIFNIFLFFILIIDPLVFNYVEEFKIGLFYIITISILIDLIILILHSFCYKYCFMADFSKKIKTEFEWRDI